MDFDHLMKIAASNQAAVEKRFQRKKETIENEKAQLRIQESERKKEARKKLKKYEADSLKSRLIYEGLLSRTGEPLNTPSSSSTISPSISTSNNKTTPTNKIDRHSQASTKHDSKTGTSVSSRPIEGSSKNPVKSSPKNHKLDVKARSPKLSSNDKSKTPPPQMSKKSKPIGPVDFQNLLKIAQKNSSETKQSTRASNEGKEGGERIKYTSPAPIGVGRLLLEKSNRESKVGSNKYKQTNRSDNIGKQENTSSCDVSSLKKSQIPNSMYPSDQNRKVTANSSPSTSNIQKNVNRPYPGHMTRGCGKGPVLSGHIEKTKNSQVGNRMKPKSFYPASARLITDKHSGSSSQRMLPYRSTWVDEMSDFMQKTEYDIEDDDEEDLGDFVVDDDEYSEYVDDETEDYSSTIREIFGYDKRRYLSSSYNDDDVMESSFAQQQFEEQRSSRIGMMEDAEEMRREEEELERKGKRKADKLKTATSSKKMKQSSLSFR